MCISRKQHVGVISLLQTDALLHWIGAKEGDSEAFLVGTAKACQVATVLMDPLVNLV